MQINLLRDKLPDSGDFNRFISRARSKKCIIPKTDDYTSYRNWPQDELGRDPILRYHIESVNTAISASARNYKFFNMHGGVDSCIIFNDSHNEIEKLGSQLYYSGKVVVVSMDNFLDIALQKCCGADPSKIRKIRDYDTTSFLFMNCSLHRANEVVYMNRFQGYDKNLDIYLTSCSVHRELEDEEDEVGENGVETSTMLTLRKIYYGVFIAAATILMNCIRVLCEKYDLSIRSQGFSNFVLSPKDPTVEVPDYVEYTDADVSFILPVLSLKKWEYTELLRRS